MANSDETDELDDFINQHSDNDTYTPESIAWRLLVDDDFVKTENGQLLGFLQEGQINDKLEATTIGFEILITIYMEMVINWYKLLYIMETSDDKGFKLDLTNVTIDDLLNPFKEKIQTLGYILSITEFKNLQIYDEFKKKCYCRIALRGLPEDNGFFETQKKNISSDKLYHFILNSNYKETTEIRNIFAVIKINNVGYKINFVKS